ncbi:MAG: CehA/McbA family metallohydrolase [Pseudomonadota bacterium]
MASRLFEYTANLHVHTTFSDGAGTIEEVIAAARKTGLDVLLINDHDTLAGREHGWEGRHGRVLVLIGTEISGRHNHILAYGVSRVGRRDWKKPQESLDFVRAQGGVSFLAHPFEKGSPLSEGGLAFTWEDWNVTGFEGLCVWNYSSTWKTPVQDWPSALYRYFLRAGTLPGPDEQVLAKWDELGKTRRVAGIAGSDAHAFPARLGPLTLPIFPYEYLFRAINTHLLLPEEFSGDVDHDRTLVLGALAQGSCFLSHDRLGPGRGFDFWLENRGERRVGQGGETTLASGDALAWRLPSRGTVRLIKDGRQVGCEFTGRSPAPITSPGVYRLEIHKPTLLFGERPWIFSNPIYVRDT